MMLNVSSCWPGHNTPIPLGRSAPARFKRWLGGLGGTIEKVYDTRPQTVLGPDDQQPVALNQALKDGGPVTQMVRRSPNVRAHRMCDEGLRLLAEWRVQQGLHGGPDPVDNSPQTGRVTGGWLA